MINNYFGLFFKEIKYGAHITALIGPSLLLVMTLLLNVEINFYALLLSYIIPLIVYSFNYHSELDKDIFTDREKVEYLEKRKKISIYLLTLLITLLIALMVMISSIQLMFFMAVIIFGGITYTYFFKALTRKIIGFKSIYATTLWAWYGTFFIVILYSIQPDLLIFCMFVFMFLRLFGNAIFFDIKDIESDKKSSLLTIPIVAGTDNSIRAINWINALSIIVLIVGIVTEILPLYAISLILFSAYSYYYANSGATADKRHLLNNTYVLADAEFLLWPLVLALSKAIFYSAGLTS